MIRRDFMVMGASAVLGMGCVSTSNISNIEAGERPDSETVEAGLWLQAEKIEAKIKRSGLVVSDRGLNDYVGNVIRRLAPKYVNDIRFNIIRKPYFNASMLPNGYMQIWTGLLTRCSNEAQFAYVLSHEIGHYIHRHSIKGWQDMITKSGTALFFSMIVGGFAHLAAAGSVSSFSRDQEREADEVGFDMFAKSGYHPDASYILWLRLQKEREAEEEEDEGAGFFASHPGIEERIISLRAKSAKISSKGLKKEKEFIDATREFRFVWFEDEVRKRKYGAAEVMFSRLIDEQPNAADARYFLGEVYRLRRDDGDLEKAVKSYKYALLLQNTPVESHRSLGLVYSKLGQSEKAKQALSEYIRLAPNASDKIMVESIIQKL